MAPSGKDSPAAKSKDLWRRRGFRFVAIALTALLILVVLPFAVILYPTLKPYPETELPAATSQLERNRQDIAHLRRLIEVDRSFTPASKAAFTHALDSLEQRAGDLDRPGLAMAAAKAVALADNGHTNVVGLVGGYSFGAVPIRLGWFADGLFVIAAASDQSRLLGGKILAVNGRTTDALVEALRPHVGGPVNLAREFVPNFAISPELLLAADLADSTEGSTYRVGLLDGRVEDVALVANPGAQEPLTGNLWPRRDLSPISQADRGAGWRHMLDGVTLPPYLKQLDANSWHEYPLPDLLYIQINRIRDDTPEGLSGSLAKILDEAEQKPIRNAVVDLRFNSGGNYELTAEFSRRLPEILPPEGRLFVLTSANTFSAAISTAARLKYFGGTQTILLGEPMGDRLQFWGEGGRTVLPNSRITIRYTTAYHDWEHGCSLSQLRTCFLLNYFYDVPAGSLQPAMLRSATFADYAAGKDPAMSAVMQVLMVGNAD
ncbi:hypothetical protein [Ensifer sp. SSB1]|uniref:hypothetical protein n=1 Tax=Ensifer sp. SSB1 TaxID=2795385 RepID=UPI001A387B1F|nr:hypothetical protein [Ensifer sp. SSB1]MBK5565430.1 hypothetical protein [Ensifer sp. SSB1]